jgi:hypothetical protein
MDNSKGSRIADKRQVPKIWENYITKLYDSPNQAKSLEAEPEENPPINKMSAKRQYFTISFILIILKHVRFYLLLSVSVTVSIVTVSAFNFLTLQIFLSSSLSFHNISSVSTLALDI